MAIVTRMLGNKMDLPETARNWRSRPTLVMFRKLHDRKTAMGYTSELTGTSIYLTEDLCPDSENQGKPLAPKARLPSLQGLIASFTLRIPDIYILTLHHKLKKSENCILILFVNRHFKLPLEGNSLIAINHFLSPIPVLYNLVFDYLIPNEDNAIDEYSAKEP